MKGKEGSGAASSFRQTLENPEATSALIEAGDKAVEHFTDLAGEVPILKWIVAAGKTVSSVRDYFLVKRIAAFLADFQAISPEKRRVVIDRLDREPEFAKRAAEAVLTLLDRVDSEVKAVWVSRGLRAYAAGLVTSAQLMRLNWAIERLLICDAREIVSAFEWVRAEPRRIWGQSPYALAALSVGLASFDAKWEEGATRPTELCELFVRHIWKPND
ncbi:hypothetical protein [Rhodanobacter denitrificans]|uniref:hypothetical protein n=1 Tax=Rhodanobacter denitrificans TaxID=666685 RepID=UPI000DF2972E|nr:hypothetical protein [Rhodanobacter denitrificans]